ncbi:hypothetical protein D3C72_1740420 [compost metagenome]
MFAQGAVGYAGAGDDDVDAAGMGDEVIGRAFQGGVVADIDGVGAVAFRVGQGSDQLLQGVAAAGQQAQLGALVRVPQRQGGAQSTRRARDENAMHQAMPGRARVVAMLISFPLWLSRPARPSR